MVRVIFLPRVCACLEWLLSCCVSMSVWCGCYPVACVCLSGVAAILLRVCVRLVWPLSCRVSVLSGVAAIPPLLRVCVCLVWLLSCRVFVWCGRYPAACLCLWLLSCRVSVCVCLV